MQISDILTSERTHCDVEVSSKKKALEHVSAIIAKPTLLSAQAVFDCLIARERLGSTGLGHGVAIPHGRVSELDHAVGVFLKLKQGVDFDAPDNHPVDLLFGLLVPEECTDEHLQILSQLAETFSDDALRERLRAATSPEEAYSLLTREVQHT